MRKTIAIFSLLMLLCAMSVLADLSWSGVVPVNGSTSTGSTTEAFGVTVNETITSAFLYLNGAGPYAMSFAANSASTTKDTAVLTELNWYNYYYIIDGYVSPTYRFYLDKAPAIPTWAAPAYSTTETSVILDWNDNAELDISSYRVYRNGTLIASPATSTYTDNTVLVGQTWSYTISAVDAAAHASAQTTPQVAFVQDLTPPAVPTIVSPSPATYTTLTPTITLNYGENVSLQVWSGTTMIKNLGWCVACSWSPWFVSDGTYAFTFKARDTSNNLRETPYTMIIDSITSSASVAIADTIHLIGGDNPTVVKGTALSTVPNDYWMISFDLSMYGGQYVRATLADMVSASQNIDIPSASAPYIFCAEDYDSSAVDFDGSGSQYFVMNTYNEAANALTCTDTDPTGEVKYKVYMKIPVPGSLTSDNFNLAWNFGLYDTII